MYREIDLLKYLPMFIREYREIKKIMGVLDDEVINIFNEIKKVRDNQFILTSDVIGIKKFESLISDENYKGDTLENRKARVLTQWIYNIPYTYEVLEVLLNNLCGVNGYYMNLYTDSYMLDICIRIISKDMYNDVILFLKKIVPCNIVVYVYIDYNRHSSYKSFRHEELAFFTHRELKEEIND